MGNARISAWLAGALDLQSLPQQTLVAAAVVLALLLLIVLILWRVVRGARYIHESATEGRRVSAAESGVHPLTNYNRNGLPSDPLNVQIIATDAQLATAFAAAGWYRADEIDFMTSLRITIDAIFKRKYATAPVSNLYLYGRRQDYAFERPGTSVRERDHVRFWNTGQHAKDGRPIWIGGATKDIAVEISPVTHLPTHRIAADVDAERRIVVNDLISTGWVVEQDWAPGFGKPTQTKNALGDTYHTDGRVAVLELANVPVLLPLATQVRGSLSARVVQVASRTLRWRLPRRGRERAARLRRGGGTPGTPPSTTTDRPD
jgi:hypothetical protein